MTLDQIVNEARHLSREQVVELLERLRMELVETADAPVEAAWRTEVRRRLHELETGMAQVVDGAEVTERVRRIVAG